MAEGNIVGGEEERKRKRNAEEIVSRNRIFSPRWRRDRERERGRERGREGGREKGREGGRGREKEFNTGR